MDYTAALAEKTSARLVLLHAFHIPLVASEVPTMMFSLSEMEKDGMDQLRETKKRLRENYPDLAPIDLLCLHGFAIETIQAQAEKISADLIVMGLQGSGFFSEKIIGSNAFELMNQKKHPLLVVHHQLRFKTIKRILLATDNRTIPSLEVLRPLKNFAEIFKAQIYILHVSPTEEVLPPLEAAVGGVKLDHFLEGTTHHFFDVASPNFMEGLNNFADEYAIDLTVAVAREHGFFEKLFRKNHIQDMMYHVHTSILTLHE